MASNLQITATTSGIVSVPDSLEVTWDKYTANHQELHIKPFGAGQSDVFQFFIVDLARYTPRSWGKIFAAKWRRIPPQVASSDRIGCRRKFSGSSQLGHKENAGNAALWLCSSTRGAELFSRLFVRSRLKMVGHSYASRLSLTPVYFRVTRLETGAPPDPTAAAVELLLADAAPPRVEKTAVFDELLEALMIKAVRIVAPACSHVITL